MMVAELFYWHKRNFAKIIYNSTSNYHNCYALELNKVVKKTGVIKYLLV